MKTVSVYRLAAAMLAAICMTACSSTDPEGLWDPIKVDKGMVLMRASGGCDTIRVRNYSGWWLSGVDARVNDTTIHRYPEYRGDESSFYALSGDWYDIQIPADNRKLLVVRCAENSARDRRELTIDMTVGDAFTSVRVIQSAAD